MTTLETTQSTLPPGLYVALQTLAHKQAVGIDVICSVAFQVVVMRLSGRTDVDVYRPTGWQDAAERSLVCIHAIPDSAKWTELADDPTFEELVARMRHHPAPQLPPAEFPEDPLIEGPIAGRTSLRPIRHILFETVSGDSVQWTESEASSEENIFVTVMASPQRFAAVVTYPSHLFDAQAAARLLGHLASLLEAIAEVPSQQISRLPIISDAERQTALVRWNATERPYPNDRCLHHLVKAQADIAPDRVALVCGEMQLSYGELNQRADHLARYLIELGMPHNAVVGIMAERSIEMIVGLLAILKAGGAYLPLDPDYPADRLVFMLGEAENPMLLVQSHLSEKVPAYPGRITYIDRMVTSTENRQVDQGAPVATTADDLAYVMFTSGTTGEPKGIAVPHRAVMRLVVNADYVDLGPEEVVLQLAPFAFDASVFEIWGALVNGSRLVIAPPGHLSLEALQQITHRHGVTTLWLTAGLFEHVVQHRLEVLRPLRQVLTGGDIVPVAAAARVVNELRGCRLVNCYGPTESTTFACCHEVTLADIKGQALPIGRPISNTRIYVLDEHLEPQPIGTPGELFIGGDGLACGYFRRADLTATRFIEHDFGDGQRHRLYRTGDLARYRADGIVEFLGRSDDQVKIRGHRVEPGEVEAVLGRHPDVTQAVVIAVGKPPGERRLVALVVPTSQRTVSHIELRQFLKERLPAYMIPSVFATIDAVPLTTHGKVDRHALINLAARVQQAPRAVEHNVVLARSDGIEGVLTQIWGKLLKREMVGRHDDFFDMGGDSLLAVCLFAELDDRLGMDLPMAILYDHPTIATLAEAIRCWRPEERWPSLVAIAASGSRRPFFCVHGLSGDVFNLFALPAHLSPDQPLYGLRGLDVAAEEQGIFTVESMAHHYLKAMRSVQPHGPYLIGGYSAGGVVAFEMARQLTSQRESVALLAMLDAEVPFGAPPVPAWHWTRVLQFLHDLPLSTMLSLQRVGRRSRARTKERVQAIGQIIGLPAGLPTNPHFETAVSELDLSSEYIGRRVRYMVAFYQALLAYSPQVYEGSVTVLRARQQELRSPHDPTAGWGALAATGVTTYHVPGSHLNLLKPPHLPRVAACLQGCLDRAEQQCKQGEDASPRHPGSPTKLMIRG